ncbi:MAG: hypothetical protein JWN53_2350 [Gemmatimonadetes bacterium]|jgi:hypothetical protein|nr:hypothetical protein [Gemmatimonadota bacterium]
MTPTFTDPLVRARAIARLLDTAARVPGTSIRFGLDPLLGLVPGAGDLAGAVLSGYVVLLGARLGVSRIVILRMLTNVAIDTIGGTLPIIGDAFDVGWKSNTRNLALLEGALGGSADGIALRPVAPASRALVMVTLAGLVGLAALGVGLTVLVVTIIVRVVR